MKEVILSPDCTIRYWIYNPKAKKTVVMVHGFTGSHEGFQYIVPLLPDIRFIVPDLPGFGLSTIGSNSWSIEAIASLMNDFVRSLKLKKPHVLGHSMGGLVASHMLDLNRELYDEQVILISPVPTTIRANDKRRVGAILGALQYKLGHTLPGIGPKIVKSRTVSRVATKLIMTTTDHQLQKSIYEHHYDNLNYISSIKFYSKLHKDINRQGANDKAATLKKCRVLLINGDKDTVTPVKEQLKLARAIQPEQFVIIPGVGHLAHYETPQPVAEALLGFLQ